MTDQPKRRGRPPKATASDIAKTYPEASLPPLEEYKVASPKSGIEVEILRKYTPEFFVVGDEWVENVSTKDTIKLHTIPKGERALLMPDEASRAIRNGIATTTANTFNG